MQDRLRLLPGDGFDPLGFPPRLGTYVLGLLLGDSVSRQQSANRDGFAGRLDGGGWRGSWQ